MTRFPLRYQLTVPLLAVAIGSLLAVALIGARITTRETRQRIEGQLGGVTEVLTSSNFPLTVPVLKKMRNLTGAEFVLTDPAGIAVVTTFRGGSPRLLKNSDRSGVVTIDWANPIELADQRFFHSSLPHRGRRGGEDLELHVLFPYQGYQAAWRSAFFPPLAVGVVAVLAIALVTQLVAARISRVARRLGENVQRLADGDFTSIELPARDDELRDLAVSVNQTAGRLAEYEQQVRRTEQLRTVAVLGAGLAHEIRNAATGCRMAVDLHAEGCVRGHDDESLTVAKQQLYLMESRLQRFLELGKKPSQINKQAIELGDLVDDIVAIARPVARHAGVALDWDRAEQPVIASADAEMFGQAVVNLVLNAIEAAQKQHAACGIPGRVSVVLVETVDRHAELLVCDSGAGPKDELSDSLFEPFVTSKQEGVGLGLAVVKQVVDAHGGQVDWNRKDGLTRFRIRLPIGARELSHA